MKPCLNFITCKKAFHCMLSSRTLQHVAFIIDSAAARKIGLKERLYNKTQMQ